MDIIKIDISREEAKELLDFYEAKRQQFVESNRAIFNKLKEHKDRIAKLKNIFSKTWEL